MLTLKKSIIKRTRQKKPENSSILHGFAFQLEFIQENYEYNIDLSKT